MKKLLSRLLFCCDKDVPAVLQHIFVGVFNVIIPFIFVTHGLEIIGAAMALTFGYGFLQYQHRESRVIKDRGFPEIQGWLLGIGIMTVFCMFIEVR